MNTRSVIVAVAIGCTSVDRCVADEPPAAEPFVAIGASADSQEVVVARFDRSGTDWKSSILQREPIACEGAPVVYHNEHRTLYVLSLRAPKGADNQMRIFSVGANGRLQKRGSVETKHGSAYASLDRSGKYLLTASYFEGHVDVYRLNQHGTDAKLVSTTFAGRDKAHSILTDPANRYCYVPYVKDNNALFQYRFNSGNGTLMPIEPQQAEVPTGVGPRHVAFHPNQPYVFFSNEQHLGVTCYRQEDNGNLTLRDVCQAGELRAANGLAASDIAISPDGHYVFVGVRDFAKQKRDVIHSYRVGDAGDLTHVDDVPADSIPWGLQTSLDGHHLFVTAAHGETLTLFAIDESGHLDKRHSLKWGKMIRDIALVPLRQ